MEIQEVENGIIFPVKVQPRSSKNEISGVETGILKVRLTSPPVDNAANRLCIKLFSKWLSISKSKIVIVSGLKNRNKKIKIIGLNKNEFNLFIKEHCHEGTKTQQERR